MAHCAHPDCGRQRPAGGWRRSGLTVDDAWFCSAHCVRQAAAGRFRDDEADPPPVAAPRLKLGSLLMHRRAVTPDMLEQALLGQRQSGLPLGTELQRLGVTEVAILRALAEQQGVDYLTTCDVARVHDAPGDLNPDTARTLGVVPFEADPERARLKVACQAPVPRRAIEALRRLTGWTAEPYLVTEDIWNELASAYGEARPAGPMPFTPWCDADDAAARVATIAESARGVRVRQARCEPFTWVRLEGAGAVEDLFITDESPASPVSPKEERCRPAPTSH